MRSELPRKAQASQPRFVVAFGLLSVRISCLMRTIVAVALLASFCVSTRGQTQASASPARIQPVPFQHVTLGGPFWETRMLAVRTATLNANREQCEKTGRLANFDRAASKVRGEANPGEFQGLLFNDSDVYKMMEGWAYVIAHEPDPRRRTKLEQDLEALIARVSAAQWPDGYINTYYTLKVGLENRLTREEWDHETYCMGHLIEAGVAHFQVTGRRTLLDVAIRAADYLVGLYQPEKLTAPPGHQELELAVVRLADATGQPKYATLAKFLVDQRGKPHRKLDGTTYGPWGDYAQDHLPFVEQREAVGHAVRAGYLYAAATDLAMRNVDGASDYIPALDALWEDITQRRVFVTGGIGPSGHNEGFTTPYDIPTKSAYQETCASIALCLWAERMFRLHGDAAYMDQFEMTLYNAVLAGVSTKGDQFFYVNPLACGTGSGHQRQDWFGCACCPPNVLRFLSSLSGNMYAQRDGVLFVNLYAQSDATIPPSPLGAPSLREGAKQLPIRVKQATRYPFDGRVQVDIDGAQGLKEIALRMPSWAPRDALSIRVTSGSPGTVGTDGYIRVKPTADRVSIEMHFDMTPRRVQADPRVKATVGRVAVRRGPIIYAAEEADNPGGVGGLLLPVSAMIRSSDGPNGVPTLSIDGLRIEAGAAGQEDDADAGLYRAAPTLLPQVFTMTPYFMWANRGSGSMAVWMPETTSVMDPPPLRGVKASASFVGHGDGPGAFFDRLEPSSSGDHTIPRFTFWDRKGGVESAAAGESGSRGGGEEWIAVEFDQPRMVSRTAIYWFDDTGVGECRVPKRARVEVLVDDAWKPVSGAPGGTGGADATPPPDEIGVRKDTFNTLRFAPVTTKGLRIVLTMQEKFSTGALEWTWGR